MHFLQAFFNFIWNMVITAKTTTSQQQHRIPSASKPPGGASTCTWYSQPGTFYLFCSHFIWKYSPIYMHFFRFHMKYGHKVSPSPFIMHLISYEIISQMKWFFYHVAFAPQVRVVGGQWKHRIWKIAKEKVCRYVSRENLRVSHRLCAKSRRSIDSTQIC